MSLKIFNVVKLVERISRILPSNAKNLILHSSLLEIGIPDTGVYDLRDRLVDEIVRSRRMRLIIPTFTFGSIATDWRSDRLTNDCGALAKAFIECFSQFRTIHPIHSVIDLDPEGLSAGALSPRKYWSSFGSCSVWHGIVKSELTYNVGLGIGLDGGGTYLHAYEEMFKVPYRHYIDLPAIDIDGIVENRFIYYARTTDSSNSYYENDWEYVAKDLRNNGLYAEVKHPFFISYSCVGKVYQHVRLRIKSDPLYMVRK